MSIRYFMLGLFCLMGISALLFSYGYLQSLLTQQRDDNQELNQKIILINQKLHKLEELKTQQAQLQERYLFIKNLVNSRKLLMQFFTELTHILPAKVTLISMKKMANKIFLSGYAASSKAVVRLIGHLEDTPWLKNPVLITMINSKEKAMKANYQFKMSVVIFPQHRAV